MRVNSGHSAAGRAFRQVRLALVPLLVAGLGACSRGTVTNVSKGEVDMPGFRDLPDSTWTALAHRRVFFGHQSVGWNIVSGITELVRERPAIG
ncbi:MAG TPA: hypothetical protein VLV15_02320, partial [Dongiaceae bacterium]|nr:hypothetical protein [Dongiaceae bacterium]